MDIRKLIIAIDGPAGSGKSSIGDMLAEGLGYIHLSTGLIYRAIGWKANKAGIAFTNIPEMMQLIEQTNITFQRSNEGTASIIVDGKDISDILTTNEVGLLASAVSAIPEVRQGLLSLQRRAGKGGGVILDGRDIGTVVFPNADLKFYLDASAEERAKRRFLQLQARGSQTDLNQLILDIRKRDYDDSHREVAPLRQADDAVYIDSTDLSPEDVVQKMMTEIRKMIEMH